MTFDVIIDPQHAFLLLRKVKLKPGKKSTIFSKAYWSKQGRFWRTASRYCTKTINLVFYWCVIPWLFKMPVIHNDPKTLDEDVAAATAEQNIRKIFNLRAGHEYGKPRGPMDQIHVPTDVDLCPRQRFCTNCKKYGHGTRACRSNNTYCVNVVSNFSRVVYWNWQKLGDIARHCPNATPRPKGSYPKWADPSM